MPDSKEKHRFKTCPVLFCVDRKWLSPHCIDCGEVPDHPNHQDDVTYVPEEAA